MGKKGFKQNGILLFLIFICVAFPSFFFFFLWPFQFASGKISSFFFREWEWLSGKTSCQTQASLEEIGRQVAFQELQKENQNLREQLHFLERHSYTSFSASVLSHSIGPFQSTFLIDKGEKDGVAISDPVIVSEGILVGQVIQIMDHQSVVRSLTDRKAKIAATILNEWDTFGVVQGTTGGFLLFDLVPQEVKLEEQNIVITSGLEEKIPSGLFLGTIFQIEKKEQQPFQKAMIKPLVDYRHYSVVRILHL